MTVNRLAWQTPLGAMLWEFWSRYRMVFWAQGAALLVCLGLTHWHAPSESSEPNMFRGLLQLASMLCFLGTYLHFLACFTYVEVGPGSHSSGYPARLLLKPMRTIQLILVPMIFGGLITTVVFILWMKYVLQAAGLFSGLDVWWTAGVALSFFWWTQALSWGNPSIKINSLLLIAMVVIHFLVWVMPQVPIGPSVSGQRLILAALLLLAVPCAWLGLRLTREGAWEGPPQLAWLWSWVHLPQSWRRRAKFDSAFAAQFWLEWRRLGWMLPGFVGVMALLVFPIMFKVLSFEGAGGAPPPAVILSLILMLPLLFSTSCGAALAKFDLFGWSRELPVYIAMRPMTNGGFVIAKLTMALATSAAAWLLAILGVGFCLALTHQLSVFSGTGLATPFGPIPYLTGCLPGLILVVLWTWKNLLAGIGAGLAGRAWIMRLFIWWRGVSLLGLVALVMEAKFNEAFQTALLHWLTALLIVLVAAKTIFSAIALAWGWQRNTITASAIAWISSGWLLGGILVAVFGIRACRWLNHPELALWIGLSGFLVLPLADLAIAPLALAWNRHR